MGISRVFALTTLVVMLVFIRSTFPLPQSPEEKEKSEKCHTECGDLLEMLKTMSNGDWVCVTKHGMSQGVSPCLSKCMDQKPDEDQTKCWCSMCKTIPLAPSFFCTGPGEGPLTREQCDPIVCEGKAQFRGDGCHKKA